MTTTKTIPRSNTPPLSTIRIHEERVRINLPGTTHLSNSLAAEIIEGSGLSWWQTVKVLAGTHIPYEIHVASADKSTFEKKIALLSTQSLGLRFGIGEKILKRPNNSLSQTLALCSMLSEAAAIAQNQVPTSLSKEVGIRVKEGNQIASGATATIHRITVLTEGKAVSVPFVFKILKALPGSEEYQKTQATLLKEHQILTLLNPHGNAVGIQALPFFVVPESSSEAGASAPGFEKQGLMMPHYHGDLSKAGKATKTKEAAPSPLSIILLPEEEELERDSIGILEQMPKVETKKLYLPVQLCLPMVTQLLGGLAVIHEKDVIHGDIKPENVLVKNLSSKTPLFHISDFGDARTKGECRIRFTQAYIFLQKQKDMQPGLKWACLSVLKGLFTPSYDPDAYKGLSDLESILGNSKEWAALKAGDFEGWFEARKHADLFAMALTIESKLPDDLLERAKPILEKMKVGKTTAIEALKELQICLSSTN